MHGDHVKGEIVIRLNTARLKREGHWLYLSRAWYPVSNTLTNQEGGRGRDSVQQFSLVCSYESSLLAGIYIYVYIYIYIQGDRREPDVFEMVSMKPLAEVGRGCRY